MADLILQDFLAQIQIRAIQLCRQPPFQTGNQTFLHSLQIDGSFIGSKDQLFAQQMQVIEYMEKCILCLIFTDQFLDIVQNQHIHALIKIHEIIRRIFPDGFRILYGKKVS